MTQGNSYFPEKETSDQVNLLVDEDAVLVQGEPPKKKCPFAKPGKKLALFSISAFVLYHLFGYCADYVPTFDEAGEYVSSMASEYEHGNCNPTIPLDLNKTFEFDPNEYPSFGLAVFGNSKHNSVTFVRNDYDKITFEPEIFISSIKAADNVHVGTHTKDERFGFGIKGPSWFKGHKECFKANIVVNIPKNLEGLDRMWIRLPSGHISSDFGGDLALKKLHFELGAGDIKLKGKTINEIELTTGCGNIEISDSTSEKVSLYARKGDIAAKDISSSKTVGATADGNVHLEIKNAKEAVAKNINGPSTLKVVSLAPVANSKGGYTFVAGSVNGDTKLSVPEVYKGRFAARTFNGEAKVETSGDEKDLHFSKNYRSHKVGHKGENADSASYAEAATFNGSPKLEFY